MFDRSRRIAILRVVDIRGRRLLRSVTFDPDPSRRQLIGYFAEDAMRLTVECTWSEYIKHTGPRLVVVVAAGYALPLPTGCAWPAVGWWVAAARSDGNVAETAGWLIASVPAFPE